MFRQPARPVCSWCGGTEVLADAHARWNPARRLWEIANVFDKEAWCDDCEGGTTLEWIAPAEGEPELPKRIES